MGGWVMEKKGTNGRGGERIGGERRRGTGEKLKGRENEGCEGGRKGDGKGRGSIGRKEE